MAEIGAGEDFQKQLADDAKDKNIATVTRGIYDQLKNDPKTSQAGDIARANDFLKKQNLLPGLEITGIDDQGHLKVTDTKTGEKDETYDLKTGVVKGSDGLIHAVTYPNGTAQRFQYSTEPDHRLIGVTDANGGRWTINADGTSDQLDDRGNILSHSDGVLKLDQQTGVITITNKDGSVETHNPDGSSIVRDKDQHVTSVTFAFDTQNGAPGTDPHHKDFARSTMKFEWKNGQLSGVTDQNGDHWTANADGSGWTDQNGKQSKARFVVQTDGSVSIQNPDGSTELYKPDGSTQKKSTTGYTVSTDSDHRVVGILADGQYTPRRVTYDDHGHTQSVQMPDGGTWENKGGKWTFSKPGSTTVQTAESVFVMPNGTTVVTYANGVSDYIAPNGTKTQQHER